MPVLGIIFDDGDMQRVREWLAGMGRRASRQELSPILIDAFEPVVAMEKSILSGHSKSGALEASLVARSGSGDRPGTFSVYSAPVAKSKGALARKWSKGRAQQGAWAERIAAGTWGKRVVYGPFAEGGHRWVKRNAAGQLYEVQRAPAKPIHFAAGAVDALGETQAEKAAEAIMDHILGYT